MASPNCGVGISTYFARSLPYGIRQRTSQYPSFPFLRSFPIRKFSLFSRTQKRKTPIPRNMPFRPTITTRPILTGKRLRSKSRRGSAWSARRSAGPAANLDYPLCRRLCRNGRLDEASLRRPRRRDPFAEQGYYEALNKEFENYETVVFELVTARGRRQTTV